jgi:hypothetical protein
VQSFSILFQKEIELIKENNNSSRKQSSTIGGLVLILIIMLFGYSGIVDIHSAIIMVFSIYALELFYACITAWPAWLISGFLKIRENLDVYDTNTNFNPFNFK